MKAISIMYHDIVEHGGEAFSGFAGVDADLYKVETEQFAEQLKQISKVVKRNPDNVLEIEKAINQAQFFITFDDGGRGAYLQAAALLESYGWCGHFFIATNFIDTPTFLSADEIRELNSRGHIIGSHSASHPLRMASLTESEILREWQTSIEKLADILGYQVLTASVPGGHFSAKVAETASQAGIKFLFTSEPTTKIYKVNEMLVLGRYTIQRQTPTEVITAIARGDFSPRAKQFLLWNTKKIVKKVSGENYLKIRNWMLSKSK